MLRLMLTRSVPTADQFVPTSACLLYTSQDAAEAASRYAQAAEMNYAPALCDLGLCYEMGDGVEKDEAKAVEYYTCLLYTSWGRPGCR